MSLADELEEFFSEANEVIVKEPLKFKAKLGIGERAYALLRARENLTTASEAIGVGGAASTVASSSVVAKFFFGGFFFTAATPIPWIIAAGVLTGGAYIGISHLFERSKETGLIVIPKYINTPLDVIAASLIELMLPVSLKIASVGGGLQEPELRAIRIFFVDKWGYCPGFVARLIEEYRSQIDSVSYSKLADSLGSYCAESPDCDKEAILGGFVTHLREIIEADGRVRDDEKVEIEYLSGLLIRESEKNGGSSVVSNAIKSASEGLNSTTGIVSEAAAAIGTTASSGISKIGKASAKIESGTRQISMALFRKTASLFRLGNRGKK
jgi:hypothetical protein